MKRSLLAVAALIVTAILVLSSIKAQSDSDGAYLETRWGPKVDSWVRASDTMCACVAETLTGPSIYCFNAAQALFRVQANSGACSLIVMQVSMNDTFWTTANGSVTNTNVQVTPSTSNVYTVGDSLNRGGVMFILRPFIVSSNDAWRSATIPWRYARLIFTTRTGYTTATASAGPTVACRTKLDSLRITGYTQRNAP